jgi:hypothetical protein
MSLVVPGRPPKAASCLRHPAMRKQSHHREQPQQCRVVLLMASSDHCLCVSNPKCRRISWKVASSCQRITNQEWIFSGSALRSVHSRAWVLNCASGSRTKTQRRGTANKPVEYHTAVLDVISTMRSPLPYQLAILAHFQEVLGSSATTERFSSRSPRRRGRVSGVKAPGLIEEPRSA